jgi:hypothetical protein
MQGQKLKKGGRKETRGWEKKNFNAIVFLFTIGPIQ